MTQGNKNTFKPTGSKPTVQAVAGEPGYGLGIAGFIVSFFSGIVGLVLSAVALQQSKNAGRKNGFAFAGLIIGIVKTALGVLAIIATIIGFIWLSNYCAQNEYECRDFNGTMNGSQYYEKGQEPSTTKTY